MPELFSNADDGKITSGNQLGFSNARDIDTGSSPSTTLVSNSNFVAVNKFSSRGGGNQFRIERSFMYFDTSGITGTVTSANFILVGTSGADGSIIAVKSNAFGGDGGTTLSTGDFDAMPGWTDGASQEGNVTKDELEQIVQALWKCNSNWTEPKCKPVYEKLKPLLDVCTCKED